MRVAPSRVVVTLALIWVSVVAAAQPPIQQRSLNIPAQEMSRALRVFAQQTGLQIAFAPELTVGLRSKAVKGNYTPSEALDRLLDGTGLRYRFLSSSEVAIVRAGSRSARHTISSLRPTMAPIPGSPKEQDGPARGPETAMGGQEAGGTLEEVIVTAQMRRENAQTVPMSITTLSADALAEDGVHSIEGLAQVVPGLSINNTVPGQENVTLRGIAASGETTATVAFYLDDVPLPTGTAPGSLGASDVMGGADPAVFDLNRVEVLRGPQGTLYGASSMGGTVRFITESPNLGRAEGTFEGEAGDTDHAGGPNYSGTAVLNLPLANGTAAVRGGIQYRHEAGYADRVSANGAVSRDTNFANFTNARLEGLVRVGHFVELRPMLYIQDNRLNDVPIFASSLPPFAKYANFPETERDTTHLAALTARGRFGSTQLTSITAYTERELNYYTDYGNLIYGILEGILSGISPDLGSLALPYRTELNMPDEDHTVRRDVSQELRLESTDPNSRLQWLVGAFFLRDRSSFVQNFTVPGWDAVGNAVFTPVFGFNPLASLNDQPFLANLRIDTNSYALFGNLTFHLSRDWTAQAGVRWFDDSRERTRVSGGLFGPGPGVFVTEPPLPSTDHGFTPRFSINYRVGSRSMLYAAIAKGFRQGGANATIPSNPQCNADEAGYKQQTGRVVPDEYQPDSIWSYELGSKNAFFGGRVRVNGSVYYLKWSGIQQTFVLDNYGPGGCGFDFADNAGSATSKGAELDVAARPIRDLTLRGAFSYDRAELDAETAGPSRRLPFAPEVALSVGADYSLKVTQNVDGLIHVDESFSGAEVRGFVPTAFNYSEGHRSVTNMRVSAIWSSGVDASLYVENLFNSATFVDENPAPLSASAAAVADLPDYTTFTTLRPRTIGVNVTLRF